jgi:hypothetical protein
MGTLIPFLDVKKLQSSNILESDQHHSPSAGTLLMHGCCDCTDSRVRHAPWWAMMVKCLTLGFYQYEHEFISSKDTETLPSDPGLFAYHNSFTNSIQSEKKPMAKFAFPPEVSVHNNSHILETELDITEQLNDDPNVKSNGRASYALARGEYIETELDITEPLNEDPNVESNGRASYALARGEYIETELDITEPLNEDPNVESNGRASYALAKGEYIETELDITEPLNEDPNVESNRRASEALATNSHSDSKHDFSHASLPADQNVAKNTRY